MNKGLEALTELRNIRQETYYALDIKLDDKIDEDLDTIEKELKALEIIKKIWKISFYDEEQMISIDNCYSIIIYNKEEYDLLKEVFDEEKEGK